MIFDDMQIIRPQVCTLVEANLTHRVGVLETSVARLLEKELSEKALDNERELRYQQRYEAQTAGIATAMVAQEKAVAAALAALDKQSTVEGAFLDRRLTKTEPYGEALGRIAGGDLAVQNGWKYLLAAGSLALGIAGILLALFR
jgi:hypothetical protein